MARVKACRLCGRRNEPDEFFCEGCGTSLADVPAMDEGDIERRAADAGDDKDEARAVDDEAQADDADEAGADGQPEAEGGAARGPLAPGCALLFSWGRVPVAGELNIGRETGFSPIGRQLDAYPTVSRQHAVVRLTEDRWTVLDLRSTNGTWVNGSRLASGGSRVIGDGDRVGFSQALQAEIQIGGVSGV